jgi:hypothetical protein
MPHTLMSLDTEWPTGPNQPRPPGAEAVAIAHPALRGLADLDALNLGAGFGARLQHGR